MIFGASQQLVDIYNDVAETNRYTKNTLKNLLAFLCGHKSSRYDIDQLVLFKKLFDIQGMDWLRSIFTSESITLIYFKMLFNSDNDKHISIDDFRLRFSKMPDLCAITEALYMIEDVDSGNFLAQSLEVDISQINTNNIIKKLKQDVHKWRTKHLSFYQNAAKLLYKFTIKYSANGKLCFHNDLVLCFWQHYAKEEVLGFRKLATVLTNYLLFEKNVRNHQDEQALIEHKSVDELNEKNYYFSDDMNNIWSMESDDTTNILQKIENLQEQYHIKALNKKLLKECNLWASFDNTYVFNYACLCHKSITPIQTKIIQAKRDNKDFKFLLAGKEMQSYKDLLHNIKITLNELEQIIKALYFIIDPSQTELSYDFKVINREGFSKENIKQAQNDEYLKTAYLQLAENILIIKERINYYINSIPYKQTPKQFIKDKSIAIKILTDIYQGE